MKATIIEYIHYLMKMNDWTPMGLLAGFSFGIFAGLFIAQLIKSK